MNMSFLPHELIVDNFAGGGGTSTGLVNKARQNQQVAA